MLVIDVVASFGLDGRAAEEALDRIGITTNEQIIPDDPRPPLRPSGLRLGTPACTTRGMNDDDMATIAQWILTTLRHPEDAAAIKATQDEVKAMCRGYPVPGSRNSSARVIDTRTRGRSRGSVLTADDDR